MSQPVEVPHELAKLEKEVVRWRQVRKLPCPIPGNFWDRAVVLAGELGVGKVARALRLQNPVKIWHGIRFKIGMLPGGFSFLFLCCFRG